MKLLYWKWNSFMGHGVEQAFQKKRIAYDIFSYILKDWEKDDVFEDQLEEKLAKGSYDAVFSINYTPLITKVCGDHNIPYISWIYDSPIHIRDLEWMKHAVNHIFLFDRGQVEYYETLGIHTSHLPLAASPDVFAPAIRRKETYSSEVSLVGQLYQSEYFYYTKPLTAYDRGFLEGVVNSQMQVYGGYFLGDVVTDSLLEKLNQSYEKASSGKVQIKKRELEYLLAQEITARERYLALQLLSKRYAVSLYSGNRDDRLQQVKQKSYVDYETQMPLVFANSRVNLNISLKSIRTGIPLRVLDVLACGGFLISNMQAELPEYFKIGEELVVYQDLEELVWLCGYYLEHEDERRQIAANGRERILKDFRFEDRIEQLLAPLHV